MKNSSGVIAGLSNEVAAVPNGAAGGGGRSGGGGGGRTHRHQARARSLRQYSRSYLYALKSYQPNHPRGRLVLSDRVSIFLSHSFHFLPPIPGPVVITVPLENCSYNSADRLRGVWSIPPEPIRGGVQPYRQTLSSWRVFSTFYNLLPRSVLPF